VNFIEPPRTHLALIAERTPASTHVFSVVPIPS
jgi:hypothetical protein